jgi:hypothetical protein
VIDFPNDLKESVHPRVAGLFENHALSSFLKNSAHEGDYKSPVGDIMEAN